MKMGMAYIVLGSTGEYSDRTEWCVCVYFDKQMAEKHAEAAEAKAREIYVISPRTRKPGTNPFDPEMMIDDCPNYWVDDCEIRNALPEDLK